MGRLIVAGAAMGTFILAGCAGPRDGPTSGPHPSGASAQIRDASGRPVAIATVRDLRGLTVSVTASGLGPGTYGVHLHAVGRCDPPDFATAGPHWNPTAAQHGRDNPRGPHFGDLPNLVVGADGRGRIEFSVTSGSVRRGEHILLDGDGAALVIHANADDYRTDPSGNSGGRIACGAFA